MPNEKIEARLLEEIRRVEATGQLDREIPVIIEHMSQTAAGAENDYNTLEQRVRAEQRGILNRLADLGVTRNIRQMTLSNALEAQLTPAQIKEIAAHSEVKRVILNREELVTTAHS